MDCHSFHLVGNEFVMLQIMREHLLKKWAISSLWLFIFGLFQTNNAVFTTNDCEKVYYAVIRTHDLHIMSLIS